MMKKENDKENEEEDEDDDEEDDEVFKIGISFVLIVF